MTLLGPSGCGKTTTLRLIAGFLSPDEGNILLDGKDISEIPPYKRPFNTVFQRYALFPHLDVYDNIAFGLKLQKLPSEEIDKRVRKVLKMVSMTDYEDRDAWNRKALVNISKAGFFSSDRTIAEYNRDIWKLKTVD